MKKFIKYKWPDEVIHALGDMGTYCAWNNPEEIV